MSRDGSAGAARRHPAVDEVVALKQRRGKGENASDLLQRSRSTFCLLLNEDSELLPGEAAERIGWLDPAFFVYSDEVDYCREHNRGRRLERLLRGRKEPFGERRNVREPQDLFEVPSGSANDARRAARDDALDLG